MDKVLSWRMQIFSLLPTIFWSGAFILTFYFVVLTHQFIEGNPYAALYYQTHTIPQILVLTAITFSMLFGFSYIPVRIIHVWFPTFSKFSFIIPLLFLPATFFDFFGDFILAITGTVNPVSWSWLRYLYWW